MITKLNTEWQLVLTGVGIVQIANTMDGLPLPDETGQAEHKSPDWDGLVLMYVGAGAPSAEEVDYLEVKFTLEQGFEGKTVYARTRIGECTVKSVGA